MLRLELAGQLDNTTLPGIQRCSNLQICLASWLNAALSSVHQVMQSAYRSDC